MKQQTLISPQWDIMVKVLWLFLFGIASGQAFGQTGSVGDFVWKDTNANGIQDDGPNSGMSDVSVYLLRETTPGQFTVVDNMMTRSTGFYSFTGLSAGNYKLFFDIDRLPYYCQPTSQTVATPNDATNSKIDASGHTPVFALNPADPNTRNYVKADAGFSTVPLGSIGDYVWNDLNDDGIQNDGNTGMANVGLKLLNSDGVNVVRGVLNGSQQSPAVTTNGSGLVYATFNPANNILMLITGFDNLTGTVTSAHIHTGVNGASGPVAIDLVPLGFPTGIRTGNAVINVVLTTAQRDLLLTNKLYVNIRTTTNPGGEIRAQLMACEFTNASGNYLFSNLPPDQYTVVVDTKTLLTNQTINTRQNSTAATEATDSDFNPATAQSDPVTVDPANANTRDIRTIDLALKVIPCLPRCPTITVRRLTR